MDIKRCLLSESDLVNMPQSPVLQSREHRSSLTQSLTLYLGFDSLSCKANDICSFIGEPVGSDERFEMLGAIFLRSVLEGFPSLQH